MMPRCEVHATAVVEDHTVDMGDGQSALVVVNDIEGPVYVYKVPQGGL